jgi:primosomal protein N' (replication factor Y)
VIAKVVIDIDHYKLNKTYDYKIPASLIENLKVGMRIFVPFQKKVRSGIVINIDNFSKQKNIKNILEIDIMKPLLNKNDLERIDFMRKSYAMNYYEAIKLYMPNIFKIKYKTKIIKIKDNELTEKFKEFFNKDKIWVLKQNQKEFLPRLNYIQQKGYIKIKEEILKNSKLIKYNEVFKIDTNNHEETDKNKIGFEIVGSLYSNIDLIKQKIESNIKKNQSTLIIVPEKNMIKKISVMLNL